jgi:hypothetical protein
MQRIEQRAVTRVGGDNQMLGGQDGRQWRAGPQRPLDQPRTLNGIEAAAARPDGWPCGGSSPPQTPAQWFVHARQLSTDNEHLATAYDTPRLPTVLELCDVFALFWNGEGAAAHDLQIFI